MLHEDNGQCGAPGLQTFWWPETLSATSVDRDWIRRGSRPVRWRPLLKVEYRVR